MKKRFIAILMTILTLASLCVTVPSGFAATDANYATKCADALNALGLFNGTANGYELSRAATRVEALVMLIRLLGKDAEAKRTTMSHPFNDVPAWGEKYVAYAYGSGLTKGVSANTFGSNESANANMYITFVLRALGYSDSGGADFTYSTAATFGAGLGLTPKEVSTSNFQRGDVAIVSYFALGTKMKGKNTTLADKLVSDGIFTAAAYKSAQVSSSTSPPTAPAPSTNETILSNDKAKINVTYTADGYISAAYVGGGSSKIKFQLTGPKGTTYSYDLNNTGKYEVFPLSEGDGAYEAGVYVNISGTKYSVAYKTTVQVKLKSIYAPFLVSNQYVNYTSSSAAVAKAASVAGGITDDLKKIEAVYSFVVTTLTYDKEKAANVKTGYLPDIDKTLSEKKGICFDYAALMTAMLRSQGVPCKLVIGYAGTAYHAWINTYTAKTGWVDGMIYFDGKDWKLMDPTFASSSNKSDSVMEYIGDGKNYSAKYYY